jgi:prepilin-type N-terminal cleavage/methylation domain-containing protein
MRRGYSAVELLVVVAIVTILAATIASNLGWI